MLELQRRQRESKTKEQLELFEVEIGMIIKKPFNGKLFEGMVIFEVEEDEDILNNDGNPVKVWKVLYKDSEEEELDFDEILQYRVRPPIINPEQFQIRGRPMQALELFCGSGVVSQEFRQRSWKTNGRMQRWYKIFSSSTQRILNLYLMRFGLHYHVILTHVQLVITIGVPRMEITKLLRRLNTTTSCFAQWSKLLIGQKICIRILLW
jgi:hypothetical protein